MHELYREIWGHAAPEKKFETWGESRKRQIMHHLDRTQLIPHVYFVELLSESRYNYSPRYKDS